MMADGGYQRTHDVMLMSPQSQVDHGDFVVMAFSRLERALPAKVPSKWLQLLKWSRAEAGSAERSYTACATLEILYSTSIYRGAGSSYRRSI